MVASAVGVAENNSTMEPLLINVSLSADGRIVRNFVARGVVSDKHFLIFFAGINLADVY